MPQINDRADQAESCTRILEHTGSRVFEICPRRQACHRQYNRALPMVCPFTAFCPISKAQTCCRATASLIIRLVYGIEVKSTDDELVRLAGDFSRLTDEATKPGRWLVDSFPACGCSRLLMATTSALFLRQCDIFHRFFPVRGSRSGRSKPKLACQLFPPSRITGPSPEW